MIKKTSVDFIERSMMTKVQNQSQIMELVQEKQIDTQLQSNQSQDPHAFQLIQLVGSNHRYQTISLIIWCTLWLITGCILLGTPFLVYVQPYSCDADQSFDGTKQSCREYVCSKSSQQRKLYEPDERLDNIASVLMPGDIRCDRPWMLDVMQSLVYFGSFSGYILLSMVSDNLGRKKSILISMGIAFIGMLLIGSAPNIPLTAIGLFLTGFGSDVAINICFYFITETVSETKRMKHSILIQLFFSLGCLLDVGFYFFIGNWRIVFWIFLITPTAGCLLVIYFFIQETPYFMVIKQQPQRIKQELLKISKINKTMINEEELQQKIIAVKIKYSSKVDQKDPLTPANIENPIEFQKKQLQSRIFTVLDLFRYKSIRFISISICLISFFMYISYYGPILLVSKFGFNLYINGIVVSMSEIVIYPFCYFLINKWKRRKVCINLSIVSLISSFLLIFVLRFSCDQQSDSSYCFIFKLSELALIFIFRFCASMEFSVFLIYCNQLLPAQVRGIGIGFSSALGTIASTTAPYLFGSSVSSNKRMSIVMISFCVISLISALLFKRLPETLGLQLKDQIEQIKNIKEKPKTMPFSPEKVLQGDKKIEMQIQ